MLFNSLSFLLFFPVVVTCFFSLPHRFRWMWLLAASCYFYMYFIPIYIFVLFTTIVIDYVAAIMIERRTGRARTAALWVSIVSTCLVLFIFKYGNFVSNNLAVLAGWIHWNYPIPILMIVLPIGLSFHTFQSLSYVIEVYRGKQKAERHFGFYALYVMFFPQLIAGPIERPQNLLHQFRSEHLFNYEQTTDGLKLMAWGMFKKAVIADRLALFVNHVYGSPTSFQGISLIESTVFFAFQIYCDFSGYSDIARGGAQVMGFHLMENFRQPYFAKSVLEFWARWHISLSTWFKDYLFFPLAGNRASQSRLCFTIFVTFLVSGIWHGANWTFLAWGAINGFYVLSGEWTRSARARVAQKIGLIKSRWFINFFLQTQTFALVCFAWIFFRSASLLDAQYIATHLGSGVVEYFSYAAGHRSLTDPAVAAPLLLGQTWKQWSIAVVSIGLLGGVHALQRRFRLRELIRAQPAPVRWALYYAVVIGCLVFGEFRESQFIYFQF